jgi:hypothetical protein
MIPILIQYILLACGLVASLALFVSVKGEMQRSAVKSRKRLEEMAVRLSEAHAREADAVFIPPPRSGLNLNKRVQAMRMVRRKEDVSTIAAALGVTRQEIELLIRVQGFSSPARAQVNSQAAL